MNQDEEIVKSKLQEIARKVDNELPEDFGFIVLTFKFNEKPDTAQMMYVSNVNRDDVVKAMDEFIQKTKGNYGNDIGKY